MRFLTTHYLAAAVSLSSAGLVVLGTAMPAPAASLHGPLDGQSADLMAPTTVVPKSAATLHREKTAKNARTYFEPERYEPAAETCTFSLDVLCSNDTDWLNQDVFGTEYRFDPSDDTQGAPGDGDLGLTVSSGLSGQGADGRPSVMETLSEGALSVGAFSAD